ncbi:MBOAT family O-acyltransferase [Engelhardtia mirabilis]|uniref:Peptidoglycan O-acetyltransferase n=1 Tax=Engelhardtia mirabilis TaxID=2528011 RepID=A0A518BRW7_9BACT|nr:Peptidoglycan O-acetyltransferase [Planctomycetes bacterium Pla133]QDV04039.1 Peptidoglycan O-acetyltransferase [Planctomycetes bacterium Pla86]
MSFNSAEYLLFLPLVLILHGLLEGRENRRHWLLLVASYGFYMSWNWRYAGLIALSTLVDFWVGKRMSRSDSPSERRLLLMLSLVLNLGMLAVFKYWGFFAGSAESVFELFGSNLSLPKHDLLLPVGISFYTFQTLSYTIDLYRRQIDVEPSLTRFALFVSFFPQLVAGPIVRASDFLPQLREERSVRADQVRRGMARIFRGLIKKIVFADILAVALVDPMFASPGDYGSLDLLLGLYAYAFQIYGDFSGYSDIAIGSALCLGYELPENFNRPYLSQNVREFWTRWHISLSSWLRDYLYIPLGGNRVGPRRTAINLMLTMGLGGLWHGAAWNFVLWGIYHGLLLMFARSSDRHAEGQRDSTATVLWRRIVCFHLVVGGWLLFRVNSLENLADYATGLVSMRGGLQSSPLAIGVLALAALAHFFPKDVVDRWQERGASSTPAWLQGAAYAALIVLFVGATLDTAAFIYFQF